jgi:hypothetical protein
MLVRLSFLRSLKLLRRLVTRLRLLVVIVLILLYANAIPFALSLIFC